jgi:hypothetical protein
MIRNMCVVYGVSQNRTDASVSTSRLDDHSLSGLNLATAFGSVEEALGKSVLDRANDKRHTKHRKSSNKNAITQHL